MYYGDTYEDHEFEEGFLTSEEAVWIRDPYYGSNPKHWK